MSFSSGLKKEAGLGDSALGAVKALGKRQQQTKQTVKAVASGAKKVVGATGSAFREGQALAKGRKGLPPPSGSTYAKIKARKMSQREHRKLPDMEKNHIKATAADAVKERHERIKNKSKGPSFAMRHPIVTGLTGLGAGKLLFSESKPKQERQPAVEYPDRGY